MELVSQHLQVFQKIGTTSQGVVGAKLRPWAASLKHEGVALVSADVVGKLPEGALCRNGLREFCARADTPIAFLAIAAWGGMHRLHGGRAWSARTKWIPILEEVRSSERTRGEDFASLHALQVMGSFPGVRAPYFTKLLFFLRCKPDAYIMDQWTAKSVNLLMGREIVKLSPLGLVEPDNDWKRYEEFCNIVDYLAKLLECDGSAAEHALISRGGRKPWKWREYVKSHFPNPKRH